MQIGLFNNLTPTFAYGVPQEHLSINLDEMEGMMLLSDEQQRLIKESPYSHIFLGKSLDEIGKIHQTKSNDYYRKSLHSKEGSDNLSLWYDTMNSFETYALEKELRKIDSRLVEIQEGKFYLIEPNGTELKVSFRFSPKYFSSAKGTNSPIPHFEFTSPNPTEISATGYKSHFLTSFTLDISSFCDLLIKVLRIHLKITSTIVLEGKIYKYDEKIITKHRKPVKNTDCPDCGNNAFNTDAECDICGYYEVGE